jgi:hypothetical protein
MNPVEIEEAVSQLALEPFDRGEFPFSFLRAFGNPETTIKRLRTGSTNQSDVGGVLQRSNIHIATCDAGEVEATLDLLRDSPKTATAKAKFILATDGDSFQAEDRSSGETVACEYSDFPDHFGFFLPLAGITTIEQIRESSFDIRATGRLNKLYVELLKDNPDWATAERRPDMNHFMARLIFCFFAEDTDIFVGDGLFTKTVEQMSARDSSDTHMVISEIFRAMDTRPADREITGITRYGKKFPYVNGQLFGGSTEVPRFTKIARSYLNHIGNLNWKKINPDIFGSMIQAVADDEERSALGMHYTSVPSILKVLNPLILDDLGGKLDEAGDNGRKLLNLRNRMARIRVFDPACGSGNFLVIAYKQMRKIEAEINQRRGEPDRRSDIPLTNFRGIELRNFPAEIARLALIIAEFQCDVLYRGQQEALAEFLPLNSENWITCGNALRLDWLSICPPYGAKVRIRADDLFSSTAQQFEVDFSNEGGETYICGNPPYQGSKWQTDEQKDDLKYCCGDVIVDWKTLDYVAGWFVKAVKYSHHQDCVSAFVSTNSINQGQLVSVLWPYLMKTAEIRFAHTSFKWANLAARNAGVTVAIVALGPPSKAPKLLFEMDGEETVKREVANINAYLAPAENVIVQPASSPAASLSPMVFGNMPRDGGNLLLDEQERSELLEEAPEALPFVRDFVGSEDFIKGRWRSCLWIDAANAEKARSIPPIRRRLDAVAAERGASKAASTRKFADLAYRFVQIQGIASAASIIVPRHSSEARPYLPVGVLPSTAIVADSALAIYDAPNWNLALIASRLHLVWIATVCGKLKTDFRYSSTLGWNTFPVPTLSDQNQRDLTHCAEAILLERERLFPATIAELYDPSNMPESLRRAHDQNDEVVERIYAGRRFRNDTERLSKLFEMYADR